MGPIGMQEMIAVFVIALVLFGPKKLPELGRMLGKGLSEFRRAKSELKATFESHLSELERETQSSTTPVSTVPDYSSSHYSYPYDDGGTYETGSSSETVPSDTYGLAPSIEPSSASEAQVYPSADALAHSHSNGGAEAHSNGSIAHAMPVPGTVARGTNGVPEERSA